MEDYNWDDDFVDDSQWMDDEERHYVETYEEDSHENASAYNS
jgi:hypothetical protein